MSLQLVSRSFVLGLAGCLVVACGGGGDDDESPGNGACKPPAIVGTAVSLDNGTAKLHGSGMLPAGLPNGFELELLIREGNASYGVFPTDLFANTNTCGAAFSFQVDKLPAGTFGMDYELFDPKSDSFDPAFTGHSTNTFTLTDGQSLEFVPTF